MAMGQRKLVVVFRSFLIHEVYIARSRLESKGITSFLNDEHLNYTIGTAFVEEYKLLVDVSDYDAARSYLSLYKT